MEKAKVEVRNDKQVPQQQGDNSFINYVSNPRSFTLKKWFNQIIGDKYQKHEGIMERVSTVLITDRDLKDFGSLMTEVYEVAYRKAISDYKKEAENLGIKVNVVPGDRPLA